MSNKKLKTLNIDIKEIKKSPGYPSIERLSKGPVAVIECIEEIPCNPCETVCKKKAIIVGKPITNLPRFLCDECDGCGKCLSICPGLAIFLVDNTFSESEASISIPYELLPLPEKGDLVDAIDRNGNIICEGRIVRVQNPKAFNHTAVVTFSVPKKYSEIVRNFKLRRDF